MIVGIGIAICLVGVAFVILGIFIKANKARVRREEIKDAIDEKTNEKIDNLDDRLGDIRTEFFE